MMRSMHLSCVVEDWGRVHMSHRHQADLEYNDIAQERNNRTEHTKGTQVKTEDVQ
jgi:hypothetical protein